MDGGNRPMNAEHMIQVLMDRWQKYETYLGVMEKRDQMCCAECNERAEWNHENWPKLDRLCYNGPHAACLWKARARWIKGYLTFHQMCQREVAGLETTTELPHQPGLQVSVTEVVGQLTDELTTLRSELQRREDAISRLMARIERMEAERATLKDRVRLLVGERTPETDEEYTALAYQAIHYAGGPNGRAEK